MENKIRIIMIEDSPADAQMVLLELESGGIPFSHILVDCREDYIRALESFKPDIIISDHTIPGIEGGKTLAIAREKCPDVPFIFVTGTIGEESAIETLKQGATDYVLKDRLVRLIPSVKRALQEAGERKKTKATEERYRNLVHNMPDALYTTDLEGNITFANPAAEALTGYKLEKLLTMSLYDLYAPEYHETIRANVKLFTQLKDTIIPPFEREVITYGGKKVPVQVRFTSIININGEVTGFQGIIRDLTMQKNMEKQLVQAQKMEAIGNLSEGIAHDFNNLLTAMMGNLQIAKLEVKRDQHLMDSLHIVEEVIGRAAELIRRLLNFGRPQNTEEKNLSLSRIVKENLGFLRSVIPSTIMFEEHIPADACPIKADASLLTQIITNLCVNARDAMRDGGTIRCAIEPELIDEEYCRGQIEARPGEYFILTVSDTGTGIPQEIRDRIFEPFFTTKGSEKGTGLGLSMVYSAVRQMNGWIRVFSEPGNGTEFKLYFPRAEGKVTVQDEREGLVRGGTETVLLADDEPQLRRLATKILEKYGYKVIDAKDAEDSIALFKAHQKDLNIAVIDQTMPHGGGTRVLGEIHRLAPDFPVIIASGYSEELLSSTCINEAAAFLQKPFTPQKLLIIVRTVLDQNLAKK